MSWRNRAYEHADEAAYYPFVQWVNNGDSLEPRSDKGGFACPVGQSVEIPGSPATIHHRNGKSSAVIFADALSVAVLRTRFTWVKDGNRLSDYVRGARGKLQALCLVKPADGTPTGLVILTFTGVVSRRFRAVHRAFQATIRKATGGEAPSYAFWMRVGAGEIEMVGGKKKSPITSIELLEEPDPDRDYVGDVLVDSLPWKEILSWADAWKNPGPNGSGEVVEEEQGEDQAQPQPREGTLEWARRFPLPFEGTSVKKGTPLGELSDGALEFLTGKADEYPQAAQAAGIIRHANQQADTEEAGYEPPF